MVNLIQGAGLQLSSLDDYWELLPSLGVTLARLSFQLEQQQLTDMSRLRVPSILLPDGTVENFQQSGMLVLC